MTADKFVFLSSNFEPLIVTSPTIPEFFTESGTVDGYLVKPISGELSDADILAHYYFNETTESWATRVAKPFSQAVWDRNSQTWFDPRSLEELKAAKWEEIKMSRLIAIEAPLITTYGTFDNDAVARSDIAGVISYMQALEAIDGPQTTDFTLADNSVVTLTTAEMLTVGLALGSKVQAAHAHARELRALIQAATAPEMLSTIEW